MKNGLTLVELLVIISVIFAIAGFAIGIGRVAADRKLERIAVERNLAEYVVDKTSGEVELKWNTAPITNVNGIGSFKFTNGNQVLVITVSKEP